jgi:hypothetical protein
LSTLQRMFFPEDIGVLFDYVGISNLFEDSSGTTPATVGSPVGRIADLSGKGNHASQATTGNKPTLRTTPTTGRHWLEAIDSARVLNITFGVAPGTMYVGRVTAEGMEWLTETWGTTVNILRQDRYNAGIVARSRDWTASEKELVEAYFKPPVRTLIAQPTANPAIGDAFAGGYYTGAAWDSVAYSRSSLTIGTGTQTLFLSDLSPANNRARTPDDPNLPLYAGQSIRLAPRDNTGQVFMGGSVVSRSGGTLTVSITSVTGSGTFDQWVIAAPWRVVLAPKSGGESTANMQYKTADTAAPVECRTLTNGRAATAAMIAANTAAGSVIYPAADFVRGVNDAALSGYTDWELPARDWLELMWRNLKPVTLDNSVATRPSSNSYIRDANTDDIALEGRGLNRHSIPAGGAYTAADPARTALALFQTGGAQTPPWEIRFWSSSEYSATDAWTQHYYTSSPGYQSLTNKTLNFRVRAVRREIL